MAFEVIAGLFPLMFVLMLAGMLYVFISRNMFGRRGSSEGTLAMGLVVLLVWVAIFPSFLDIMSFDDEPDCIQEDWVDCDIYNIPRDECEKDVTEEGPYYDVRKITTYTKLTCTHWEDGTMLEAREHEG